MQIDTRIDRCLVAGTFAVGRTSETRFRRHAELRPLV
jgi:hypothetical protein